MRFTPAALIVAAGGLAAVPVGATAFTARFSSCVDSYTPVAPVDKQMVVNEVYATIVNGEQSKDGVKSASHDVLHLDLLGTINSTLVGIDSSTQKLATLFVTMDEAGVKQWDSRSWVCNSTFSSNLTGPYDPTALNCPLQAGDFGMNVSVPLLNVHALTTLHTQVHVVDTGDPAQTITCVDIYVTPYEENSWPYRLFLWFPISLAIAYFITTWAARFAAGWVVSPTRSALDRREASMLKWGTMLISGLSGERFGVSAALLRFVTPGLRDIMHHIQFVTMLAMIAINWPSFFYPIVAQCAWADLVWNVSIVSDVHPTTYPVNYTTPLKFKHQMEDPSFPLYMNATAKDRLLDIDRTPDGMHAFAQTVGLRNQDLFGTCLCLFLMLAAGIVAIHLFLWFVHGLTELFRPSKSPQSGRTQPAKLNQSRNSLGGNSFEGHSRSSSNGKEWMDNRTSSVEMNSLPLTPSQNRPSERLSAPSKMHRIWKRFAPRGEAGAFHFSALYGNLLRLILTFHFPITAFSVYQLTLSYSSIVARVFAALSFVFISIAIPAFILWKISRTPTGKLYDAARTLLALGTMYNVYEAEKQLYRALPLVASLVQGIVIGAGQGSGLAQTIVLVIVELCCFVATTFWSPWGEGAGMGVQVVFISILKIASIIMTMVLSRDIRLDNTPKQWMTYAILILQAIIFVFYFIMILTKILEGLIRLFGGAPFDESTHPIDGGIFAAIMDLDCLNGGRGGKAAARKRRKRDSQQLQQNVSIAGSLTTQMMLDRHSQGVDRHGRPINYQRVRTQSVDQYGRPVEHRQSMSDQGSMQSLTDDSHGRILDGWKPAPYGGEKLSPSAEAALRRQSWGGQPPAIRVTDQDSHGPMHVRARSSSTVMDGMFGLTMPPTKSSTSPHVEYNSFPPPNANAYPPNSPPMDGRERALRPPPLTIPRRPSLNNIRVEEGPEGKRRKGLFGRSGREVTTEFSDSDEDEPRATHRRRRVDGELDRYDEAGVPRGWRALFSRRRRVMDDHARDLNYARKVKAVNASGAAFAGIDATTVQTPGASSGFRVQRKGRPDVAKASVTQPPALGSGATTPLLAPPPPSSFRVNRGGDPGPTASSSRSGHSPTHSTMTTPGADIPLQHESIYSSAGPHLSVGRSRPSPSGSNKSSPSLATVLEPPSEASPLDFSGYNASMFQPLDTTRDTSRISHASDDNMGRAY